MDFNEYASRGLSGLSNLGNTCFLNSTLQCLSHTYEFQEVLKSPVIQRRMKNGLLKEYKDLLDIMWSKNCIISPGRFIKMVQITATKKKRDMFTGYDQNDVSEFLHFLLETFHEELSRKVKMTIQGDPNTQKDKLALKCYEMMTNMYQKEYSEIVSLFFGIHVSRIVSETGELKSITPEPFFTVALPIPSTNVRTNIHLLDCFDKFTEHERMSGDNAWTDDETGDKITVDKGVLFWSLPKILIVELKRYSFVERGRRIQMVKNNSLVSLEPNETLDLSKYVVGYSPSKYQYQLYGVCNHIGGMNGGHYTAFVRNADNEWYHFNDRSITKVNSTRHIITPKAYALWFRQIE